MGKRRATSTRTAGRQALARRNTLDYVRRLGLRKAAHKVGARVADLRRWLEEGFPSDRIERAIGLAKPGGTHVSVRGSRLDELVKQVGKKRASELTGQPTKKITETLKNKPGSKVVIDRKKLSELVKKDGAAGAASKLGTQERAIKGAARPVLTKQTKALAAFAKNHGFAETAKHLGVTAKRLSDWIKNGIPRDWESDIGTAVSSRSGRPFDPKKQRNVEQDVRAAIAKVNAWNRGKTKSSQIAAKVAERWARLGVFDAKYSAIKDAFWAAKKAPKTAPKKPGKKPDKKPPRRPPPPPIVPPKSEIPDVAQPPTPPSKPPTTPPTPPPPPEEPREPLPDIWKANFLQARYEAMLESQQGQRLPTRSYKPPPIPIGRIKAWKLVNRHGLHVFRTVAEFVSDLDLDKIGKEISRLAHEVWKRLAIKDNRAFMLITLTFAVMGDGHPFYPDAFIEGDSVNFVIRNLQIYAEKNIDRDVRVLMREIYEIDSEVTPLFLEHYEISKSAPST